MQKMRREREREFQRLPVKLATFVSKCMVPSSSRFLNVNGLAC